jgi:hypothetical protein
MRKPKRSIVIGLAVAVVAAGGVAFAARQIFDCGSTPAETQMIAQFRADPFYATAPPDGTLVKENSQPGSCDPSAEANQVAVGVTLVSRMYRTPAVYGFDELRLLFDRPAAVGDWILETDLGDSHEAGPGTGLDNIVTYCRQTGGQVVHAFAQSPPPSDYMTGPGVLVTVFYHGPYSSPGAC